jgi:signal transduction histidine kinase
VPERLRAQLNTLQAEMKSVSKRVRVLDPLSISGRQRTELFALDELIRDTIEAHEAQFGRHRVEIVLDLSDRPLRVRAVKGMVVQILENLISNSIYWLDMRGEREGRFQPQIKISLENSPPTITFEDNGRGIAPENREQVFKAFFSLKETRRRRGLGLFIAREAAQHHRGTLTLADSVNPETGRLHRFVLELPAGGQA